MRRIDFFLGRIFAAAAVQQNDDAFCKLVGEQAQLLKLTVLGLSQSANFEFLLCGLSYLLAPDSKLCCGFIDWRLANS
jgi:hypothetical protein